MTDGTATQAERWAEYKRTGKTPDGRTPPDYSDTINKAYDAIYARLRGELPPWED